MPAPIVRSSLLLALVTLGACSNANMVPVRGQIASVDRKCSYK